MPHGEVMRATTTIDQTATLHRQEVAAGERFEFGKNWQTFLRSVDEARITAAEASLLAMLRCSDLVGRSLLDIGCGSGLFSLAARRQGARVHSFDFDTDSVACARELRRRFAPVDDVDAGAEWTIEQGSVLDPEFMAALGTFDIVYSWGVLHHTRRMWDAVAAATRAVRPGGLLFLALYNDLGTKSHRWRRIKRLYNRLPRPLRPVLTAATIAPEEAKAFARLTLSGRPLDYLKLWSRHGVRGMNRWRDAVDWVGGYPYEVATPEEVFDFCRDRGFRLNTLKCGGVGLGCNEFVFERSSAPSA
jgi:2-polyprenyl-6-hydroxyphenyl methylase/3-demethylubiquinone-9 3-methyltransferase